MTKRERRTFNPEFKPVCAKLILVQARTYKKPAKQWGHVRKICEAAQSWKNRQGTKDITINSRAKRNPRS